MTDPTPDPSPKREGLRYLADRFQWAAPGDQQEDAWIVRFCDNDVRDMLFTGPDAEREAWAAWERHAPGYNLYVFRLASLSTHPGRPTREEDVERVARALYEEDDPWHKAWPWPNLNPEAQGGEGAAEAYRRLARAAIRSLGGEA